MDYETVPAEEFGRALMKVTVNLLCRDVQAEVAFLIQVFGMTAHRVSKDFAIMVHAGQPIQLHSDAAYGSHPLASLLPETGPRGAGIEIRLHESDPDYAVAQMVHFPAAIVLHQPTDKPGHGLREAVILSPSGYAFVPSSRI